MTGWEVCMNTLTIVVIAIIAIFGFIGHARGFLKMLFSVLSLILTLYVATLISPYISNWLQNTNLYDSVYDGVYTYVNDVIAQSAADNIKTAMDELQLPENIQHYVLSGETALINGTGVAQVISQRLTAMIFDVLVFLVTFIGAMVIIKLLFAAVNLMSHLPIIHGINKIAGLIIGVLEGLVVVWIFFIVISLMSSSDFAYDMYRQINESAFLTFLYNRNVVMNLLFK